MTHLIYVDDSKDEVLGTFSALAIPIEAWQVTFQAVRRFRRDLKASDGIFVYKELHAWKFVSGRGNISSQVVPKGRRCQIFKETLRLVSELPRARLFNAVYPIKCEDRAFERLMNRIHRTMLSWGSYAIVICDEGKEAAYTRLARQMRVYNPIPSQFGTWPGTGAATRNIPIDRIVEDPFFKDSKKSYFVQLGDFCAYALLRRERPLPSKTRYGLDLAFANLSPILVREAVSRDPEGIIRVK
jgi:hypothetical protein